MRHLALALIAVSLSVGSLTAQTSNPRLVRAVELIDQNDVTGLRRLLKEEPSLVRRTDAGVLAHWQWTLLHSAISGDASVDIVSALVDAGAEINAQDNEGNTPLHFATKRIGRDKLPARDYEGIIRLLLERKADLRIVNRAGATPLHTAAASRADPPAIELLIRAGAVVNAKALESAGGWTPLHGAAARGSADIVTVLLTHGADSAARDARGLTALQAAEQAGFTDAARVLRAVAPVPTAAAAPAANNPAVRSPASPSPSGGGVVEGRVLWNGQPVAGAIAYVADDFKPGSVRYGTATTDEQGRFVISGVPAGNKYVGINGNQRVFWITAGTPFTMTATRFTRDFHLCKGFDPVSPAPGETVSARPAFRWEPYPDAVRYIAGVIGPGGKLIFVRDQLTTPKMQPDVDLPAGTYDWSVSAINAAGHTIGCSFMPRRLTVQQ